MNVDEIRAAMGHAHQLPKGRQKAERFELLAAAAKNTADRELEGQVLLRLIEAYAYGAERDRMPVAFGRLLRIFDDHPAELGELAHPIHWELKWMTSNLVNNPSVPLATVYRWMDELDSRYRQRGYSLRPALQLRSELAQLIGDGATAAAQMEAFITAPRDEMADCDACEHNTRAWWRETVGDDEGALELWAPLLDGELACAEEPHRALANALLPLVRTGRVEDARRAFLKGYPLVRHNVNLRGPVGTHIEFCALTGNEARGLEILNEHLTWLTDEHHDVAQRVSFLSGTIVLLRRLSALGHDELPLGDRTVGTTLAALEKEVADVVARYDARHGTTAYGERIATRLAREPLLDALPLGVPSRLPASADMPAAPGPARTPAKRGATLDELVAEARRLSESRHPHADEAWERVGRSEEELPEAVAAEVARRRVHALLDSDDASDHEAAREALLEVAERFTRLGDLAKALEARSTASWALFRTKGRDAADEWLAGVTAEAERAFASGALTPDEYLSVRRNGPFIAMNAVEPQEEQSAAEVEEAWALIAAELALAEEHGITGRVAVYHDMLAALASRRDDMDALRAHLSAALAAYEEAGQPWYAARPAAGLAQFAFGDEDMQAAEGFTAKAIEYGGLLLDAEQLAHLSSMAVEVLARQSDRERDLVAAALAAAARWDGLSEPDTLHNTFIAARAYNRLGRHAEAAALFEQAMPKVDVPYDEQGIVMTRKQFGDALAEIGRHREAAEQYLQAATLVQDDPEQLGSQAELAWYAAQALQDAGMGEEALAAFRRAAGLWQQLGEVSPHVRCLRSAAWLLHWMRDSDEAPEAGESAGEAAMLAVLAELEALAAADPSEEVLEELEETKRQLAGMVEELREEREDDE
ncbi:hypothetical protein Pth03_36840 [Planotetraspora thailandica]|uniref:Tetratricopeptide repeat protein n=1 Tax=Planotetraspora thailandica TaxID=487172 RepID=A0A8J3XWU5_9ACTN|nr:hypothetical protein [Planotetraspora thailandica]GII55295.1 hypothetical protein Pth03_36840 [Planotetraspora thailandica]